MLDRMRNMRPEELEFLLRFIAQMVLKHQASSQVLKPIDIVKSKEKKISEIQQAFESNPELQHIFSLLNVFNDKEN